MRDYSYRTKLSTRMGEKDSYVVEETATENGKLVVRRNVARFSLLPDGTDIWNAREEAESLMLRLSQKP